MVKVLGIVLLVYALVALYYGIIIKSYNIEASQHDKKFELHMWEAFLWPVYVVVVFLSDRRSN